MTFLTKFSLKNAVAVFIISFLLLFAGAYSFTTLKLDLLPDIEFPQISVEVIYPGASPEDMDELVTSKLEDKFKTIEGVKRVQSSSFESVAILNLEFPFNAEMDDIEAQVNNYMKETILPEEAITSVNRFSFGSLPIYNISLFAKNNNDLQELLEAEILQELNKIPGINSVSVGGLQEELVQITVDREEAQRAGLSLAQIKEQINGKYLSFPAGNIKADDIQIPIRIKEGLQSVQELENLIVSSPFAQDGKPLYLKDIATIDSVIEQSELTRYNLNDSLSLAVIKKQDANTVEVAEEVLTVLDKYSNELDYAIGLDSAEGIEKSVETLVREGLLGALFASVAVLLFLRNVRATIIAIISIPLSLLVSSIFLAQMDITLNVMTLGGMAVAVGRVVDDSIVVIENIFRRVRKSKSSITDDIIQDSTKEILKAITSSTLTTVVVFLPLGFVGGITGEFFLPFALTIVFSLLTSLLVAITIVPILAKFSFKKIPEEEKEGVLQRFYGKTISWSLNHKALVLVVSLLLLVGSGFLVQSLGFTFIPNEEEKTLVASVELPSSTSLDKANDVSLHIEKMYIDQSEINEVTAGVGSRDFRTGLKKQNQASYFLTLNEDVNTASLVKKLERKMEQIVNDNAPGTKIGIQELETGGPPTNNNVNIDLYSNNLEKLQEASKLVEDYLLNHPSLKYVTNNFEDKQKQVVVNIYSDKAQQYDVSGFQILGTVVDQTKPVSLGNLDFFDEKNHRVQLSYNDDITSLEQLKNTQIFTAQGPIAIKELAEVKEIETFTSIQKLDGKVFARISAQIDSENIQQITQEVIAGVERDVVLPEDVSFEGGGGSDETVETFQQLGMAMIFAIGLVYITMLITFGKARIPFIILSSLIFVPIGSFVGLSIAREPLSVSVMIGFLMLIGIVTTNAIVLVDRIGQNREEKGFTIRQSIVEAGKTRLRPILMTAFATIAALLPLAFTTSSGTLISKGLAITVIGGLTSSTLLTLIIIPVVYELFFISQVKKER
ncbi:efflux RND transporter permease subunit [Cytobacillus sp. IB215316]|uniref:efflux RND transporter permease subunit n=1 Tax=Cytobacillus sp. IB215316 TaxID=3097354 RepID=UPI002A175EC1|nr:efflux RND transporter permease subunit [Cytobacillus sp. IB215316]MDX8360066.1 efflux RND transporter permease subunit [Cytobacillus sp. IB215316]